jgi:ATP synthase protein I
MSTSERERELESAIVRRRSRRDRWLRQGERPLAKNLALVGTLGWLLVVPTLLGTFAGRALDRRLGTHVTFTAALMFAGVVAGSWLLWRKVHRA